MDANHHVAGGLKKSVPIRNRESVWYVDRKRAVIYRLLCELSRQWRIGSGEFSIGERKHLGVSFHGEQTTDARSGE